MTRKGKLLPMSRITPKRNDSDGIDSVAESKQFGERRAFNLLMEAQYYWNQMEDFRKERERNKRYTYGYQWDDIICVDGKNMTEEEYIKSQGNVPLKNNLIRRLVRNVLGVYRSQNKEPTCTARDRDEQKLGETMSTILQCNMQLNHMSNLHARTMEEFLISGLAVHRKSFGWRNGKEDCWTDYVQPNNFFIDNNMRDFRGWDVSVLGEVHDISFGQLCEQFASTPQEFQQLKQIYHLAADKNYIASFAERFGYSRLQNYDFLFTSDPGRCRVIELWRKEQKPRYRCHDYQNGDIFKIDVQDYHREVEIVNQERIRMAKSVGLPHGENYVASGHFKAIEAMSHAYKCLHNPSAKKMVCTQLSDNTYTELADGTSFDPSDTVGEGYDVMKLLPEYWYKGVNDYKNQKKYLFASSNADEPLSTAMNIRRCRLGDLLIEGGSSMALWTNTDGVNYLQEGDDYELTSNGSMDVYAMNVDGMKQVRFLGVNSQYIGAVFVDKNNKVVSTFNMYVSNGMFDFVPGDYVFCDVPKRAARLLFTGYKNNDNAEIIAVDSAEIEAIEPDWVRTNERLVGVYGLSVDAAGLPRSISGKKALCGTGTSTTSGEWKYDADGKVTNIIPPTSLNYTMKDFMNLCEMRGEGFQAIDYEMSKDIANIVMALTGDRDVQAQCGAGCSSSYTTGAHNSKGNQTWLKINGSITGNLIFGIQNFVACNGEWMDNVAINVQSFANAKKYRLVSQSGDVVDHVWHIYDPTTGTERTVQGINASDSDIARVKFGRFCDIIASKLSGNNDHNKWYSDVQWYSAASCRAVLRSYVNANAYGGLVFAYAHYASSHSSAHFGSRLAFCGEIEIVK